MPPRGLILEPQSHRFPASLVEHRHPGRKSSDPLQLKCRKAAQTAPSEEESFQTIFSGNSNPDESFPPQQEHQIFSGHSYCLIVQNQEHEEQQWYHNTRMK